MQGSSCDARAWMWRGTTWSRLWCSPWRRAAGAIAGRTIATREPKTLGNRLAMAFVRFCASGAGTSLESASVCSSGWLAFARQHSSALVSLGRRDAECAAAQGPHQSRDAQKGGGCRGKGRTPACGAPRCAVAMLQPVTIPATVEWLDPTAPPHHGNGKACAWHFRGVGGLCARWGQCITGAAAHTSLRHMYATQPQQPRPRSRAVGRATVVCHGEAFPSVCSGPWHDLLVCVPPLSTCTCQGSGGGQLAHARERGPAGRVPSAVHPPVVVPQRQGGVCGAMGRLCKVIRETARWGNFRQRVESCSLDACAPFGF